MCAARGVQSAAEVVDHIVPHRGDRELFWNRGNWQSLCKRCHDGRKQREERGAAIAFDERGIPVVASHHWHQKGGGLKTSGETLHSGYYPIALGEAKNRRGGFLLSQDDSE